VAIVSRLTAQADIVRTIEKVIHSSHSSKHAKDLANPFSNVASVCIPDKECCVPTCTSYIPILERWLVKG
jgi:hypothetical protein